MSKASPYAIDAFVEILKNQADNSKNYRTIRDKDFAEKEYYTINHYKGLRHRTSFSIQRI